MPASLGKGPLPPLFESHLVTLHSIYLLTHSRTHAFTYSFTHSRLSTPLKRYTIKALPLLPLLSFLLSSFSPPPPFLPSTLPSLPFLHVSFPYTARLNSFKSRTSMDKAVMHQRKNRRRERPGSRNRWSTTRKSHMQQYWLEDIDEAHDPSPLPFEKSRSSPILRQNFDQSWERWKARDGPKALSKMQLEQEQLRLCGGDVDDDVCLCEPMLQVVIHLFGALDYSDP
jgi:hypothetical protein